MPYILYRSIEDLLNNNFFEQSNTFINNNINILKLSNYIDSLLMNIPSKDLVINTDNKNIIIGKELVEYIYLFVEKNIRLSNNKNINALWRNKTFHELNESLKLKLLTNTLRVIYIPDKYSIYYSFA